MSKVLIHLPHLYAWHAGLRDSASYLLSPGQAQLWAEILDGEKLRLNMVSFDCFGENGILVFPNSGI